MCLALAGGEVLAVGHEPYAEGDRVRHAGQVITEGAEVAGGPGGAGQGEGRAQTGQHRDGVSSF